MKLFGIKFYLYSLIAIVLILSLSITVFIYWQSQKINKIQDINTNYHLESINFVGQAREKLYIVKKDMLHTMKDFGIQSPEGQNAFNTGRNLVGLVNDYISQLVVLREKFDIDNYISIIEKIKNKNEYIVSTFEKDITYVNEDKNLHLYLDSLMVSMEQLRRLHISDYDNLVQLILKERNNSDRNLFVFISSILIMGIFIAKNIISHVDFLIEEQKIAENNISESKQYLTSILDAVADGIIVVDKRGIIRSTNPAVDRIFQYKKDELINVNIRELLVDSSDGYLNTDMGTYIKNAGSELFEELREVVGICHDGQTFPMDLSVNEMQLDGKKMYICTVRDARERKKLERMKNEFISTVSHELRTPLTSIRGSLGLIANGVTGEISEKGKELANIACNNSERLVRLINDILDIEKIESGKMEFSMGPLDLITVIKQSMGENEGYAKRFNVSYHLAVDELDTFMVIGDQDRLNQLMTNLLSNAAKFSPDNEKIDIVVIKKDNNVRVMISDHGQGIPVEFQDRIFHPFAQADGSDTRRAEGTGLGLSICKAIVEKHNGQINFLTAHEVGTTFYFDIPEYYDDTVSQIDSYDDEYKQTSM